MKPRLSLACWEYPRTKPILDGSVSPDGIELVPVKSHPANSFWRVFRFNEFDVTEMSLSSFIIAKSKGKAPWKAIPVFPCKIFFHTHVLCNVDSEIEKGADLKGKRIGLPEYQMTAAVWLRGILEEEFGVKPADLKWFQEREEHRMPIKVPGDVSLEIIPKEKKIFEMVLNREIDAVLYSHSPGSLVDRSTMPLHKESKIKWLFPNRKAEEIRYYQKTGIFPANHVIVIKDEIIREHPWSPVNIFMAFMKAKAISRDSLNDYSLATAPEAVWQLNELEEQAHIFGGDPYPYGIKANRAMLEKLIDYCYRQGVAERKVGIDELFVENLMDR